MQVQQLPLSLRSLVSFHQLLNYHRILEQAKGKIEILPGGGIDLDNRQTFIEQLGVTQLHGTKVVF